MLSKSNGQLCFGTGARSTGYDQSGYRRYLYRQGNLKTTDGALRATARSWLVNIKSAPPAIPFDAPVTGMDMTTFSTIGPRRINIGKSMNTMFQRLKKERRQSKMLLDQNIQELIVIICYP